MCASVPTSVLSVFMHKMYIFLYEKSWVLMLHIQRMAARGKKELSGKKCSRMKNRLSSQLLLLPPPHTNMHQQSLARRTQGESFKRRFGLENQNNRRERKKTGKIFLHYKCFSHEKCKKRTKMNRAVKSESPAEWMHGSLSGKCSINTKKHLNLLGCHGIQISRERETEVYLIFNGKMITKTTLKMCEIRES